MRPLVTAAALALLTALLVPAPAAHAEIWPPDPVFGKNKVSEELLKFLTRRPPESPERVNAMVRIHRDPCWEDMRGDAAVGVGRGLSPWGALRTRVKCRGPFSVVTGPTRRP